MSRWFDFPTELRLLVFQHAFTGKTFEYLLSREPSVSNAGHLLDLSLVSIFFARREHLIDILTLEAVIKFRSVTALLTFAENFGSESLARLTRIEVGGTNGSHRDLTFTGLDSILPNLEHVHIDLTRFDPPPTPEIDLVEYASCSPWFKGAAGVVRMKDSTFFNVEACPGLSSIHGLEMYRMLPAKEKFDLHNQFAHDPVFDVHSYQVLSWALQDDDDHNDGEWLQQFLRDGAAHTNRIEITFSCQFEVTSDPDPGQVHSMGSAKSVYLIKPVFFSNRDDLLKFSLNELEVIFEQDVLRASNR